MGSELRGGEQDRRLPSPPPSSSSFSSSSSSSSSIVFVFRFLHHSLLGAHQEGKRNKGLWRSELRLAGGDCRQFQARAQQSRKERGIRLGIKFASHHLCPLLLLCPPTPLPTNTSTLHSFVLHHHHSHLHLLLLLLPPPLPAFPLSTPPPPPLLSLPSPPTNTSILLSSFADHHLRPPLLCLLHYHRHLPASSPLQHLCPLLLLCPLTPPPSTPSSSTITIHTSIRSSSSYHHLCPPLLHPQHYNLRPLLLCQPTPLPSFLPSPTTIFTFHCSASSIISIVSLHHHHHSLLRSKPKSGCGIQTASPFSLCASN